MVMRQQVGLQRLQEKSRDQAGQARECEMIYSAFDSILSAIAPASTLKVPFSMALRTALTRPASKSLWLRPVCSISRAVRESVTGTPAAAADAGALALASVASAAVLACLEAFYCATALDSSGC